MASDLAAALLVGAAVVLIACADGKRAAEERPAQVAEPRRALETSLPSPELETRLPAFVRELVLQPFTGDLDQLAARRAVRVGVTFNRTFYFLDKGVQRGIAYEYGQLVEERLNAHFRTGAGNRIHVIFLPLPRDMLLPALIDGKVDLVAAQVPVTSELAQHVAFSDPTRKRVNQILVTGPGAPAIGSVDELAGKTVFARALGGYDQGLVELNDRFRAQGKPLVTIREAPPNLEDDDLLEMVNAGLIPAMVADDYLAAFWKKVFPDLHIHEDIALRTGGSLAIAVRKNNPELLGALNTFMGRYGLGSAFGNQIQRRYLVDVTYAKRATSEAGRRALRSVLELFRKYGDRYDVDFLLMAAQGYQESRLDHGARSRVGAVGIMQVMPATGKSLAVGDIRQLEPNIHAGVKYMRLMRDRYFESEPMGDLDKALFTFAAYNAGPGRVQKLRREAGERGLDPNVWIGNVEQVASERIGRETVTYVANIFKYYIAYRLVLEETERREGVKSKAGTH